MDDLMKKVIEDYFGEPMPENINLSCPTTLHDCVEIAKHYAAQQSARADGVRAERTMSMSCPSCHRLIEIVLLASLRQ